MSSAMHMIVEAIFWFHPVVWWIGGRLLDERERACDEAVVSLGYERQESGIIAHRDRRARMDQICFVRGTRDGDTAGASVHGECPMLGALLESKFKLRVHREQLGLQLGKTTGPNEFLVIDHIERP